MAAAPVTPQAKPSQKQIDEVMAALEQAEPTVFASVVAGKIATGMIECTCVRLTDEQGRLRAYLTTTDQGDPGLALFDPDGERARAELMLSVHGPSLRLNNAEGKPRLALNLKKHGAGAISIMDRRGRARVIITLDADRPRIIAVPSMRRSIEYAVTESLAHGPWRRHWPRALRALKRGNRGAFDQAALDCGILSSSLDRFWREAGKRVSRRRRKAGAA